MSRIALVFGVGLCGCIAKIGTGYDMRKELIGVEKMMLEQENLTHRMPSDAVFSAYLHVVQLWGLDSSKIAKLICADSRIADSMDALSSAIGIHIIVERDSLGCQVRDVPRFSRLPNHSKKFLIRLDERYFRLVERSQEVASAKDACQLVSEWSSINQVGIVRAITAMEWNDWMASRFMETGRFNGAHCDAISDSTLLRLSKKNFRTLQQNFREIW